MVMDNIVVPCFFDSQCRVPCSNAAKTRNPLKFTGVPQTRCLTSFFPIVVMCLSYEDVARESCAMVPNNTVAHCNYVIPGTGLCRYLGRTRALHGR